MAGLGLAAGLAALGGCAAGPEVQRLATGRADVAAYTLNGVDLDSLRQQAGRLCPLGGEVVRQSSQGAPVPPMAETPWRQLLASTAGWLDPPARSAQLVVVCPQPGDLARLQPSAAVSAPTPVSVPAPMPVQVPATAAALPSKAPEWAVALPVGPVMPSW
jgi:hypothetical protein